MSELPLFLDADQGAGRDFNKSVQSINEDSCGLELNLPYLPYESISLVPD